MLTIMDTVHTCILCALDVPAIFANFLLVFAILTRTTPMMRPYSILLLNNAFVDISSATASILLIFLRDGHSEVYVFIGPCTLVGGWFCQLLQSESLFMAFLTGNSAIHTYFVSHSTVILLHSFCFRLYLLRDNGTQASVSARATILISLVSYFPTLLMMYCYFRSSDNAPQYVIDAFHLNQYVTTWTPDFFDPYFTASIAYLMILSPSAMLILVIARRRLIRGVAKMESRAKDHNSRIAKALSYQLLLPAGQALACVIWILTATGIWTHEIPERMIMIVTSFFALGSPLINLSFLPPYRRIFSSK